MYIFLWSLLCSLLPALGFCMNNSSSIELRDLSSELQEDSGAHLFVVNAIEKERGTASPSAPSLVLSGSTDWIYHVVHFLTLDAFMELVSSSKAIRRMVGVKETLRFLHALNLCPLVFHFHLIEAYLKAMIVRNKVGVCFFRFIYERLDQLPMISTSLKDPEFSSQMNHRLLCFAANTGNLEILRYLKPRCLYVWSFLGKISTNDIEIEDELIRDLKLDSFGKDILIIEPHFSLFILEPRGIFPKLFECVPYSRISISLCTRLVDSFPDLAEITEHRLAMFSLGFHTDYKLFFTQYMDKHSSDTTFTRKTAFALSVLLLRPQKYDGLLPPWTNCTVTFCEILAFVPLKCHAMVLVSVLQQIVYFNAFHHVSFILDKIDGILPLCLENKEFVNVFTDIIQSSIAHEKILVFVSVHQLYCKNREMMTSQESAGLSISSYEDRMKFLNNLTRLFHPIRFFILCTGNVEFIQRDLTLNNIAQKYYTTTGLSLRSMFTECFQRLSDVLTEAEFSMSVTNILAKCLNYKYATLLYLKRYLLMLDTVKRNHPHYFNYLKNETMFFYDLFMTVIQLPHIRPSLILRYMEVTELDLELIVDSGSEGTFGFLGKAMTIFRYRGFKDLEAKFEEVIQRASICLIQ